MDAPLSSKLTIAAGSIGVVQRLEFGRRGEPLAVETRFRVLRVRISVKFRGSCVWALGGRDLDIVGMVNFRHRLYSIRFGFFAIVIRISSPTYTSDVC